MEVCLERLRLRDGNMRTEMASQLCDHFMNCIQGTAVWDVTSCSLVKVY
jgi:hypothetical protein